uniref:FAD-binding PCMH-type domain-containing protein n=1 Tax=Bionectria ochroleuca TaxID=29856 RepID=A0A8H7NQN5_BIOOC
MKIYTFLQCIAISAWAISPGNAATKSYTTCRKLSKDPDWPSPETWEAALPGVTPIPQNSTNPLPDYRFRAHSIEDVQAAVRFATEHNVRLAVITTGHDQLGRSDAGSGLLLDLSFLRGIKVHESFTSAESGTDRLDHTEEPNVITPLPGVQEAVTFGPAAAGLYLNYALDPSGLFTVSGAAATVAIAGGWGQNGGYGPLTSQYGLGVDQWLEAKVVTPNGQLRIANDKINRDLFWAVRGGGGSTFGVVVEATWKVYPTVPMTGFNWWMNSTLAGPNSTDYETGRTPVSEAMEYLFSELPGLQEKGITAYIYASPTSVRCYAIHPADRSGVANANAVWGPILSKMQSFPGLKPFQSRPYDFVDYKDFFDTTYGPLPSPGDEPYNRGIVPFDSRLLGAEHFRSPNITYALRETGGYYGILVCSPGGKLGDGSETSNNPGWRRAVALVVGFKTNTTNVDGLRVLAPDMGTYINEASTEQENWTSAFWGTNYARLSEIKSEIDPNMTFWTSPGIHADHMEVVDGRACLIEPPPEGSSLIPPPTDRHVIADLANHGHFLFGEKELIGATYPAPGTWVGLQPPEVEQA